MDSGGGRYLVESLSAVGWKVRTPGQTVTCPSTETVIRSDRRGGPAPLPRYTPRWDWRTPPPDEERRPLVWATGREQKHARHCQKILVVLENGYTFIRPVPVDRSVRPLRFLHTAVPASVVRHTTVCGECGIMSELVSVPARMPLAVDDPRAQVQITQFSIAE